MDNIKLGLLLTLGLYFIGLPLYAQQFEIKNADQTKKKLDYNADWYVVQRLGIEDECCNSRRYLGNFVEVSKDSIQLRVKEFEARNVDGEKSYYSKIKFNTKKEYPVYTLAISDLKNLQEKESEWKTVSQITGVTLLLTSVATAIHALVVDGDDRKALFISSGIQLGTSITLISIGASKNEKYKLQSDAWQF